MSFNNKDAAGPSDPQVRPSILATESGTVVRSFGRQFQMSEITANASKFNHAIVGLNEESILLVADIVKSASYILLKIELIKRLSVSEPAKLDHLLEGLTLGDRTPAQLLCEMRQLAGSKIDDDLLKSLWLQRLPEGTQAVLACISDSLEALAAAADKVHEVHARPTIPALQQPSDEVGELKREIAALVASMAEMRSTLDAHHRTIGYFFNRLNWRQQIPLQLTPKGIGK